MEDEENIEFCLNLIVFYKVLVNIYQTIKFIILHHHTQVTSLYAIIISSNVPELLMENIFSFILKIEM